MRLQFVQAVVENRKSRFPNEKFLEAGACLSPSSWPDAAVQRALFRDQHALNLAQLCHIDSREALDDFRRYKNNTHRIRKTLQILLQRVRLMPVSSAECERGFSCMNANDTSLQNRLSVDSLSALIFIKVNNTVIF